MSILAVALGGAIGAVLRYLLGALAAARSGGGFPWVTLAINVTGSLLLGFLARYLAPGGPAPVTAPALYAGLTVGLCGGYTTFSTFSYEVLALAERGAWARALLYVAASVTLALAATAAGAVGARAVRSN